MKQDIFQAIADPTRRAILTLIAIQALTPNAMAEKFDMSRQAVSKHIKVLQECELVKPEHSGREIYYHFNPKKMQEIDNWLAQFRKIWETQFNQLDKVLSKIKFMNFEVGGRRFYAMVSPEGQEHWSIQKFTSISPKTNFKMSNAFADKDENPELPGSDWDLNFSEQNGTTKVSISIYNESLDRLEKMIEMGFQGGFTMGLQQLDELLLTLK